MALLPQLTLCLLAAAGCILQVQGSDNALLDCCHATMSTPFPDNQTHRLRSYRIQGPHMGCHLPAIVLITKKGRELCAPSDAPWALALTKKIDARKAAKQKRQRQRQ